MESLYLTDPQQFELISSYNPDPLLREHTQDNPLKRKELVDFRFFTNVVNQYFILHI